MSSQRRQPPRTRSDGVVAVELALGMTFFLVFLFLVIEVARYAQQKNLLLEATRVGARIAATCSNTGATDQLIADKMRALVAQISDSSKVSVATLKADGSPCGQRGVGVAAADRCADTDVAYVSVAASGATVTLISMPFIHTSLPLPEGKSVLPRELMSSSFQKCSTDASGVSSCTPVANPACS
ncbi:MAG: pilus assembly protein [Proteobacteria bacterium]|uniref:TadE/TadG family type IV pilus assembly protein n=1 Tax=Aquabacterium sp. TaxID=1872578 RepID=UPI0035C66530|nr:pilus assembly protein [Pseudomonadota bacterium]